MHTVSTPYTVVVIPVITAGRAEAHSSMARVTSCPLLPGDLGFYFLKQN